MRSAPPPPSSARGARGLDTSRRNSFEGVETQVKAPQSNRISDWVFEQLSEAIRDFQLLPGAPISELAVAGWLNVSRSPVRQAIARLVDLGLVSVIPQVGSYIAPISLQEVEEAAFIRSALETNAFQRAIAKPELNLEVIQSYVDVNRRAAEDKDLDAFFESDERLHQVVFELAGLSRIWQVVRRTKIQLDRLRRLSLPRVIGSPGLVDEHQTIVDALRQRNEPLGVEVIQRHATRIFLTIEDHRSLYPDYFTA